VVFVEYAVSPAAALLAWAGARLASDPSRCLRVCLDRALPIGGRTSHNVHMHRVQINDLAIVPTFEVWLGSTGSIPLCSSLLLSCQQRAVQKSGA
jgi:hypothetical protein